MEVTVNLSEKAYQYISWLSRFNQKSINELVEESLESRYTREVEILRETVKYCSDKEVLDLAFLKMPDKENKRFSLLSQKNREDKISKKQKIELENMFEDSRITDLRKAIGIAEAVKRGLITSINDLP